MDKLWNCWHDDGRFVQVQADGDYEALLLACEYFEEEYEYKISVSERIL